MDIKNYRIKKNGRESMVDENALIDLTPESMQHKTPVQLADLLEKILQAQLELMQAGQGEAALLAAQKTQPLAEHIAAY